MELKDNWSKIKGKSRKRRFDNVNVQEHNQQRKQKISSELEMENPEP